MEERLFHKGSTLILEQSIFSIVPNKFMNKRVNDLGKITKTKSVRKDVETMSFQLKRINPNQTQVYFADGRFETLTDEELEDFLSQVSISESEQDFGSHITD